MNDKDIEQFKKAFKQFLKQSETEMFKYHQRMNMVPYQESIQHNIERKAAQLKVTPEYYIQEFL